MYRTILGTLVGLMATGVGVCQQPPGQDGSRAILGAPIQVPPSSPGVDEINAIKETLSQLQDRLKQIAPDEKTSEPTCPWNSSTGFSLLPGTSGGESSSKTMSGSWKNGLQVESQDKDFKVHVGGTLHFDSGWNAASQAVQFGPGGIGELQDGAVFRRARIRFEGTMYQYIDWVSEFDFANTLENDALSSNQSIGSPSFVNVWIGINELPIFGTVRAGWMLEPMGFAFQTSGRWLNFMEFAPGINSLFMRSPGILMRNLSEDERVTWAFEFSHVQSDNFGFGIGDGEYAETGRLTWLPWYEDDGCQLVHLGIGATHRHLSGDQETLIGRPSVRTMPGSLEPALASTSSIAGTTQEVLDLEWASQYGPVLFQAEYYCTWIHDAVFPNQPPQAGVPLGTLFYQGAYIEALYFLTGEHRDYIRKDATFGRVIPRDNFNVWNDPWSSGAWQVGIRYAYLDLQNKGVNGATLNDIVLGLNWFLNPNTKIQWNIAFDHRDSTPAGSSGWTYIFGTRLALDF